MTGLNPAFAWPRSEAVILGNDQEAIAAAHRTAAVLAEGAIARDRDQTIPTEELNLLSEAGLFGITVPREFGGPDVSYETLVEVFRILSAADPAIGQLPQNHFVLVNVVRECGSDVQKQFFFTELLRGIRFGNAQAELGTPSTLHISTNVKRDGDGYRLNGVKYYCTGAYGSDWVPVAALDEDEQTVYAYVRRDAEGLEASLDWDPMGQRTTYSGTVKFDNVALTADQVFAPWQPGPAAIRHFALVMVMHAAIDVGIANNAFTDLVCELKKRGRPRHGARAETALSDPYVLADLGRWRAQLDSLNAALCAAGRAIDEAKQTPDSEALATASVVAVSRAKALAEDISVGLSSDMFALLGSSATERSRGLDRHWRNARTHTVHDANHWHYRTVGNWAVNGEGPPALTRLRTPPRPSV